MKPRWSRDNRVLLGIGAALGAALAGLYALVLRTRALSPVAAADRVLLFVLFYVVVLLILVLLFVLTRSGVKLMMEARRGVFGSRFRVRVVATHVGLALLPIALLVLPTTRLIERSVDQWFQPTVTATVRSGEEVAELVRRREGMRERGAAEKVLARLPGAESDAARLALLAAVREETGLDYLELRRARDPAPLAVSLPRWPVRELNDPGGEWLASARSHGAARRVEATADGGQAGRTVVPFAGGLVIAGTFDPPADAAPLRALSSAAASYRMLEAQRASLEATQVLFFLLLAFLVLLAAVWVGLVLARRVTRPIAALASSARRVGSGDFDALVEVEGGDEIAALAGAFNAMTRELRESRGQLVAANAEMAETNRRIAEERESVRTILANLQAGVVAFREDLSLVGVNDAARRLLEAPAEPRSLDALLAAPALAPLAEFLARAADGGPREATLTLALPSGARVVEVRAVGVPPREGSGTIWVVTLEDTTALVKAERAAAWEEAARRMAHEIKNPLTPIRLAAERMRRRAGSESEPRLREIVDEGATTIVEEVGTLSSLVDAFGRFARLPAADLKETDLAAVIAQVTKLYAGVKKGVTIAARVPEGLPVVKADPEQVKRALINLVDNAVAATPAGGHVSLTAAVAEGRARLEVADDGPGIPPPMRERIFDPAFSTKARGTGLGLSITQRIAAEHGGGVRVEENPPHGCRFVFEWPAA